MPQAFATFSRIYVRNHHAARAFDSQRVHIYRFEVNECANACELSTYVISTASCIIVLILPIGVLLVVLAVLQFCSCSMSVFHSGKAAQYNARLAPSLTLSYALFVASRLMITESRRECSVGVYILACCS